MSPFITPDKCHPYSLSSNYVNVGRFIWENFNRNMAIN